MTKLLALDLGLTTGWALVSRRDGTVLDSGVWRLEDGRPQDHLRFLFLAARLRQALARSRGVTLLAYEALRFAGGGPDAAFSWGGLRGVTLLVAGEQGVPYVGVAPATWKAAAGLPSGSGPEEALAKARERWPGREFATADEGVARFVAIAAAHS